MLPNARFLELLNDIEPSPTTVSRASGAHNGIREFLEFHKDFATRWESDFLSGSYARDTAIRPRKTADDVEQPDVDIIVVTNFSSTDEPHAVLGELRNALEDGYDVERTNRRSIRVETWQAHMDIVPVIRDGDGFLIPDRHADEWHYTNPPYHTVWSRQKSTDFGGRFKPLVKLFKWWRRENPLASRRPKGFVLEVLTALHAPRGEPHYGEAFAKLLENIYAAYGTLADLDIKPKIDDPAVPGNDILSKVTAWQWKAFVDKVRVYAAIARRAQDEEDDDEATRQWKRVFGDRFPAPPSRAARSVGASSATTGASAAGLGAGFVFPNQPAAPTKPRGFA